MALTRQEAIELLEEYNESDALIKHALAVEGVMRHYARKYGEDEELWGIVGLLHDLDYEKYPEEHCIKVQEILKARGVDPQIIRAIASHGYGLCCDIEPKSQMEKILYTVDELTGLVNATAIMRPSKSVMDLGVKSVKKKFKNKGFAAGVNRDVVLKGCENLGLDLEGIIEEVILGMRSVAKEIGLEGEPIGE
ncbi:MAG: HDIG domain-containing protein [Eubacterium aggregans]|uniref:HDIG domain-containing protein n=1 Tax=Eubacterium aggregans TaxID=81409 RepID=A0A1H3Y4R6_9FIRM|nr:HDIG domain-containing metalloprotein [Eubacterium aggregans]MDD4691935.1 HDIG domain-containing protein [Eubacterium aggregans]MEA5073007.1 HDIG domain-containing protein [Eubacterium aggregans]SEA06707.1 HDIG domain-containing protein [Eubacterium aggregans]